MDVALLLPSWRARPSTLLLAVTLVCLLCAMTHAAAADSDAAEPVYLLNAVYSVDSATAPHADAIWAGIDAALFASNHTAAGGRPIVIVQPDFSVNSKADIVKVVQSTLAAYPSLLGVIGPYSDIRLSAVLADATLRQANVTFLSPFTGSGTVRKWDDAVYFTRAEPRAELLVMVHYIVNTLRARRVAFMYLTGVDYGDSEYKALVSAMTSLARDPPAVYARPYSYSETILDQAAFDAMADTSPQVVIVWGMPGHQVVSFMEAVLTDPRTSSAHVMTSFSLQQTLRDTHARLLRLRRGGDRSDAHLMSSATAFPPHDQDPDHMRLFRDEINAYLTRSAAGQALITATPGVSTAAEFLEALPDVAQLMVVGWLSGKVIQQTLEQSKWIVDRNTYRAGLFQQNRYIIGGDFVLGDYGGPCDTLAASTGAVCECNQGGHEVLLTKLINGTWNRLHGAGFTYPQNLCYSSEVAFPSPVNDLVLGFTDYPQLERRAQQFIKFVPMAAAALGSRKGSFNFGSISVPSDVAQEVLNAELANYSVDIITGSMVADLDVGDVFVADAVFPQPRLTVAKRNYIYTMPVLEQEVYLLYTHLNALSSLSSISTNTNVILRNYTDAELVAAGDLLLKSAATFNVPDPSITNAQFSTHVSRLLVPDSVNLIVGLQISDAADLAAFLSAAPRAVVVICFDDLSVFYDDLVAAFAPLPPSVQARLVSYSNLPLWSDTSATAHAASPLLAAFHALLPNATMHVPSALRDLAAAALVDVLLQYSQVVNSAALLDTIYRNSVLPAYAISFGPYVWSCSNSSIGDSCLFKNYGAQSISMLSMERMLNATVPATTPPTTPSMVYRPRQAPVDSLTTAQRNGVISGSVVGGVLLIGIITLLVYCCTDSRDNAAAPKDGDEPVTLIFTDIESSTAMWAALPQLMADAIAAHHRVIRQLINENGCYEVKTVGDSFMIACKDAYSAVKLACDIQKRLLDYDWGTNLIDSKYRELELAKVDSMEGHAPPTARLGKLVYAALWAGLRVRIGIHTGLSDIRYDEVMKRYDYYGDTSNMAARTEAIANGGQVVATEAAWWALSDTERDAIKCTEMGSQGLRGVPYAVGMYQVNPVPGRTHAALRTEIDAIVPDKDAAEVASSNACVLSASDARAGPAANVAAVLVSCFAPHPPAQRARELQPLLTKWSVSVPPRNPRMTEEDYCQSLINRLAIRIATVAQAKQPAQQATASLHSYEAICSQTDGRVPIVTVLRSREVYSGATSEASPGERSLQTTWRSHSSGYQPPAPSRARLHTRWPGEPGSVGSPVWVASPVTTRTVLSLDDSELLSGTWESLELVSEPTPIDLHLRNRHRNTAAVEAAQADM